MPAKTLVADVLLVIATVFAGSIPSIEVGDGDDPDGWVDTVDVTVGTTGSYPGTKTNAAAHLNEGRCCVAADTIEVVLSAGLASRVGHVVAPAQTREHYLTRSTREMIADTSATFIAMMYE